MATVFIYALCEPDGETVRYVGKAKNPAARLKSHRNERSSRRKARWLRSLEAAGLAPALVVLEEVDESAWQEAERRWIAYHRGLGADLTNHTDGGEGLTGLDDEARGRLGQKMHELMSDPSHRAKVFTQERNRRVSAGLKGKKKSPEHVAKLPQNQKGRRLTEEHRRKISAGSSHHKPSPEQIEASRRRATGNKWGVGNRSRTGQTVPAPERLKKSLAEQGRPKPERHCERISEGQRRAWARRKAEGATRAKGVRVDWPPFEYVLEQLKTKTQKQLASELGVKPGALGAFIWRRRRTDEQLRVSHQPEDHAPDGADPGDQPGR